MDLKRLLSLVRKSIDDYNMIEENDKIAVGMSGGKDSITLLYALANLKGFYPKKFNLCAITVNVGFEGMDFSEISKICKELGVEYYIVDTQIKEIVFDVRKESNPCALCAKMRKGALNNKLKEIGFNKIAYAHHKNDVVDTLMLSLIYEGRINTFSPVTYLDRTDLTVIRPLIYVKESEIKGFINKYNIHPVISTCPVDKKTEREYVKDLISQINSHAPGVTDRIFTAIKNSETSN